MTFRCQTHLDQNQLDNLTRKGDSNSFLWSLRWSSATEWWRSSPRCGRICRFLVYFCRFVKLRPSTYPRDSRWLHTKSGGLPFHVSFLSWGRNWWKPGRSRMNWAWAMTLRCKKSRFKDCNHVYYNIKDSVRTRSTCLLNVVYYARRCSKLW